MRNLLQGQGREISGANRCYSAENLSFGNLWLKQLIESLLIVFCQLALKLVHECYPGLLRSGKHRAISRNRMSRTRSIAAHAMKGIAASQISCNRVPGGTTPFKTNYSNPVGGIGAIKGTVDLIHSDNLD